MYITSYAGFIICTFRNRIRINLEIKVMYIPINPDFVNQDIETYLEIEKLYSDRGKRLLSLIRNIKM